MIEVSAQEVVALQDSILQRLPGVASMSDPGITKALIYRVQNRTYYIGITDIFELAATYRAAIARGHIFNDGNKRTAFFVTMTFLYRNDIKIYDNDNTLENLTVEAATGKKTVSQLTQYLRALANNINTTR